MRVAFDSRPVKDDNGVGRYARCLLAALRESDRGTVLEARTPKRCDVFHAPWIDGALLRCPVPMVVTLHDLTPLARIGEYLRSGLRLRLRYLAVQRAVRVIVPSEAVAEDAVTRLEVPRERIAVIGQAAAAAFVPRGADEVAAVRERYRLDDEYLLWVGPLRSPEPRKRVAALARARREMQLVLVGAPGRWARELPDVTLTGRVSDDELAALYTGAHALVFPSEDEGFGLPPVEALACGTPVAACDCRAVREVLGERAELCDGDDLDGLIAAAQAARRPASAPLARTWAEVAAETWGVYAEAAEATARWRSARRAPKPAVARVPREPARH